MIGRILGFGLILAISGCFAIEDAKPFRPETASEHAVYDWLRTYEQAWSQHDTNRLAIMLGLDDAGRFEIARQFEDQKDLRISIDGLQMRELPDGLVQAVYSRRDSWSDATSGHLRTSERAFLHMFEVRQGRVRHVSLRRR